MLIFSICNLYKFMIKLFKQGLKYIIFKATHYDYIFKFFCRLSFIGQIKMKKHEIEYFYIANACIEQSLNALCKGIITISLFLIGGREGGGKLKNGCYNHFTKSIRFALILKFKIYNPLISKLCQLKQKNTLIPFYLMYATYYGVIEIH